MRPKVEMRGFVESAKWEGEYMEYVIHVLRPDHKDENIVGHFVTITKPEREDD